MKYRCKKCGKEIDFDVPMMFCPFCGGNMEEVKTEVGGAKAILINKIGECLSLPVPKFDVASIDLAKAPSGELPSFSKVQRYVLQNHKIDALFAALEESIENITKHFANDDSTDVPVKIDSFCKEIVERDKYLTAVAKCINWDLSFSAFASPSLMAHCHVSIDSAIKTKSFELLSLISQLESKVKKYVITNSFFDGSCFSRYGVEERQPSKNGEAELETAIKGTRVIVEKKYVYDFLGDSSEDVAEMMKSLWTALSVVLAYSKKNVQISYLVNGKEIKDISEEIDALAANHYTDFEAEKQSVLYELARHDQSEIEKMVKLVSDIKTPGKKAKKPNNEKPKTAMEQLDQLIGLEPVKNTVRMIEAFVKKNKGKKVMTHMVFEGNPGTGKTEVAKIVAEILHECGALKKAKVVEKKPSDLIAGYVGQTALKTASVINEAMGGVLFIDEAYALQDSEDGVSGFGQEAVAELIKAMEDHKGEFCVILAGYKAPIEKLLSMNPGFDSRIQFRVDFPNYSREEMKEIAGLMLQQEKYECTDEALEGLLDLTDRKRKTPNFGNAREMRNLIQQAMMAQSMRVETESINIIEIQDVQYVAKQNKIPFKGTPGEIKPAKTPQEQLAEMIGLNSVKKMVAKIVATIKKNPGSINLHMAFNGNPGTGKTEVANLLSTILYEAGALPEAKCINCSSGDLIGKYVGSTAPKTQAMIDKAMGGVLFIDEAYSLMQGKTGEAGNYGDEAIATLIKAMEDHKGEFCVILAGYKNEMTKLIAMNPGFKSRVQFSLDFNDYTRDELKQIAQLMATSKGYSIDVDALEMIARITDIKRNMPDFANARDVRNIIEQSIMNASVRTISTDEKNIVAADVLEYAEEQGYDISNVAALSEDQQLKVRLEKETRELSSLYSTIPDVRFTPNVKALERTVVCLCGEKSQGTGFLVSPYGHVLTCAHCVQDLEQRIRVAFFDEDGQRLFKYFSFFILAIDKENDIALLGIASDKYKFKCLSLVLGDHYDYIPTNDFIMAGYPYGGESYSEISITTGKIASVNSIGEGQRTTVFADMFGKPGNSGSPIIDSATSKVVGIFWGSIGKASDQINCFTPIEPIWNLINQIVDKLGA